MHRLSNVNKETLRGNCSECGPDVRVKKNRNSFRCHFKWLETKNGPLGRFKDGTTVTIEMVRVMEVAQQGRCGICREEKPLVVDHCHDAKIIRGLLCNDCNLGLGRLGDTEERVRAALVYLQRDQPFVI
jgi:hypothetical protein